MTTTAKTIGIIGLSTMGANLAKNFADSDVIVNVYNRSEAKTKELEGFNNIKCHYSLEAFYNSLGDNKIILLLVKAGQATDDTLDLLSPMLKPNDILIDLGNANYLDSSRRQTKYANYYVCGISGGQKGAREGASLMLSGPKANKEILVNLFSKVAAKDFKGNPTIEYFGEGSEGNIVKTVHNGIEYAQMQVLSELYTILRFLNTLDVTVTSKIFEDWSRSKKDYLCSIMSQALSDPDLVDNTLPKLESKGTGKWTAQLALENNTYSTLISYSYNLRMFDGETYINNLKQEINLDKLSDLYDQSYLMILDEGLDIIKTQIPNINLNSIRRVWQGGCIIRNEQLSSAKSYDFTRFVKLFSNLRTIDIPLPILNMMYQRSLIGIYGLPGHSLLAIARDVFGNHGFYNLEEQKIYKDWENI
jgi:6-phosphogluconate dehydrogenase